MGEQQVPEALRAVVQSALERQEVADWEGAARAWRSLQEGAAERGHEALELDAWVRLADVLRRADRPREALDALEQALARNPDEIQTQLLRIQTAALLLDTGSLEQAEARARSCVVASQGPLQAMALDSLAAALATRGDRLALAEVVRELESIGQGPAALAGRFRRARLDRLEGHLAEAEQGLASIADALDGVEGAAGASGAALTQLAQLALLRGAFDDTELLLAAAEKAWTQAGRDVGNMEVLALRAELAVERGALTFLPGWLDTAVRYAEERGLVLLEARLRRVRGLCRLRAGSKAGHADLDASLLLASQAGAPFLAGRTRLERAREGLGPGGREASIGELERALDELTGDRIWAARARIALAQALNEAGERGQAIEHATAALAAFTAAGLDRDEATARAFLEAR